MWFHILVHIAATISLFTQPLLPCHPVRMYLSWPVQHAVLSLPAAPCTGYRYTRQQLLDVNPAPLDPSLVPLLKDLGIGRHLSSRRSCRGGHGRRRAIKVVPFTSHKLLPLNSENELRHPHSSRPVAVNHDNLIRIPLVKNTRADSFATKTLKIGTFNARSLGPTCQEKRISIYDFILDNGIDILLIQETWFREKGDAGKCAELSPPGYSAKSFPRSQHGGGLAIVFKNSLLSYMKIVSTFNFLHTSFECFYVILNLPQRTLHLWNVYRTCPSKKNKLTDHDFFREFPELLELSNLHPSCTTVIFGDLNFHFNKPNHSSTMKMNQILDMFDLSQSVTQPTHNHGNILDCVIFRQSDNVLMDVSVNQDLSSDHYCVVASFDINVPSSKAVFKYLRSIKSIDKDEFRNDLIANVSPSQCASVDKLENVLLSLLDKHAPLVRRKITDGKCDPWYSDIKDQVIEAKKQRRRAEKKWVKTGLTVFHQMYTSAKKLVTDIISKAKTSYFTAKIENSSNSKELYNVCGIMSGKEKSSPLPTTHSLEQLPQVFCDFFVKKISDVRSELDRLTNHGRPFLGKSHASHTSTSFSAFHQVSQEEIKKIILQSKPTTCPLDPIPTPLLVEFLDQLLPTITHIINSSILSGSFPDSFKTAVVKPLLKKSTLDHDILKNYRPVSNLSFLSKILEKTVLKQLFEYLNTHSLLSPNQSAYRPAHSTETVLLKVTNDILTALDKGDVSFLTLLDLSAAFDTIDHTLLLHILTHVYGISDTALAWFQSYLTNRIQSISINNYTSSPASLMYGVPQGSVLGPILFIMYTQPLHSLIQQHSLHDQSFADDTQMYQSCKPCLADRMLQTMQTCITEVKSWMTDHKLKLNDDKTEALLIHSSRSFSNPIAMPTSISVCSSVIPFASSARNLGFIISDDMTVDAYITHICRSAYASLRQVSTIRKYLTLQATKTLMCSLVLSRLDYANSLLVNCPQHSIQRLQKVQNSAARLTLKLRKTDSITPALKQLHWLPIQARIIYKLCLHCHNFLHVSTPVYFSDLLSIYTPSRTLRSSDDNFLLNIPRIRTKTYGERAFSFAAPKHWNSLPHNIRQQASTPAFKRALKTHLFQLYFL